MSGLVGEFEVKMDEKGRFLFPSGLRKQLPAVSQRDFML
ncbi:MAG: division/cell wall cluster transcriptional repressor MraZ, partial [Bacteroidota bacterium]